MQSRSRCTVPLAGSAERFRAKAAAKLAQPIPKSAQSIAAGINKAYALRAFFPLSRRSATWTSHECFHGSAIQATGFR
jgi:hypothetical protein